MLSIFLLLKIVSFIFAISVAVVIIASNDESHAISLISKEKIMVAMIIMAVEANNDGNNIKWSFAVVL